MTRILWAVAVICVSTSAVATKPTPTTETFGGQQQEQGQSQSQAQTNTQTQSQTASPTATASSVSGGGQGGGASNQLSLSDKTTAIAFGTAAPIPINPSDCYFPKRGLGRGQGWLWGAVQLSAVLERDEQCFDDIRAQREFELARLEAEANLERARTERMRAECEVKVERVVEACMAK